MGFQLQRRIGKNQNVTNTLVLVMEFWHSCVYAHNCSDRAPVVAVGEPRREMNECWESQHTTQELSWFAFVFEACTSQLVSFAQFWVSPFSSQTGETPKSQQICCALYKPLFLATGYFRAW